MLKNRPSMLSPEHPMALAALGAAGLGLALLLSHSPAAAQNQREIDRTTENELKISVSSNFGTLRIGRNGGEKMAAVETIKPGGRSFALDYTVRNRVGYMNLDFGEGGETEGGGNSFRINNLKGGEWALRLAERIPISFDIELGVGRGDLNFSGLEVKDLNLSTGASDVYLAFDEPNSAVVENINIESGVCKFVARNLGNANFHHFKYQGGVGTCWLDFTGDLTHEVDVDVSVGMGVVTLLVPPDVGARVFYEKNWISRVECPDDFEAVSDGESVSKNYPSAQGKMNIHVQSGVGSVRILRHE